MTVRGGYLTRVELFRLSGSLDYARDDGTWSVVFYKDGRPSQEILRYALNDRTTVEKTFLGGSSFRPSETRGEIP